LYRAAASADGTDFNDVSSGNNDFTGTGGGRYAAGPGYDMASGLGTPNGTALARTLCAASIRLTNPGPRLSTVRTSVSLRVAGTDAGGFTPSYRASGLAPGLSINASTGRISGKPRRTGTYAVTVIASDRGGAVSGGGRPQAVVHVDHVQVQAESPGTSPETVQERGRVGTAGEPDDHAAATGGDDGVRAAGVDQLLDEVVAPADRSFHGWRGSH
jgi:hypothetical protein